MTTLVVQIEQSVRCMCVCLSTQYLLDWINSLWA